MEIKKNMEIIDLGLYFTKYKLLAVTDLQFGYEEYLNKHGILVPRFIHKDMLNRMENILKQCYKKSNKHKIETVLINGDLKHEFGSISETEWRHCIKFLALLQKYTDKIILVRGNHDTMLDRIVQTKGLAVIDHYFLDNEGILFVHGDAIPNVAKQKRVKTIIIGHEHPAISIVDWPRIEKYKTFLVGKWKQKRLIVMPSFNSATEGTDILKESILSPFLHKLDVNSFAVYIVANRVYFFGTVKDIRKLNKQKSSSNFD